MPRYYDIDKLKELIEAKADTVIDGKVEFLYVAKWLDLLPAADVTEIRHGQHDCPFCESYEPCSFCDGYGTDDVAEVKHSSWELIVPSFGTTATIICRACHKEKELQEERRDFKRVLPNFCENCGTKMDGERKE